MQKLLSISIAAYNVEETLRQTLESLIKSKYIDLLDILIINDGSTDNTLTLASKYYLRFPNSITVVDKENGGHGSTINVGIRRARGKYFTLLDGDDWYDTSELDKLVDYLRGCDSSMIVSNFTLVHDADNRKEKKLFSFIEPFCEYSFDNLPMTDTMGLSAITIKTEILQKNGILIDERCFYVDMEYILYPIPYIDNVVFTSYNVYQYRVGQTNQSVSTKSLIRNEKQHERVCSALLNFIESYKEGEMYEEKKCLYISKVASTVFLTEIKVIIFCNDDYDSSKVRIKTFVHTIKEKAPEALEYMKKKCLWFSLILKSNFKLYRLVYFLIRKRNNIKNEK